MRTRHTSPVQVNAMSDTETKTGRELEPSRGVRASPKQRRAAKRFLNALESLFDTKSGGSE